MKKKKKERKMKAKKEEKERENWLLEKMNKRKKKKMSRETAVQMKEYNKWKVVVGNDTEDERKGIKKRQRKRR